MPLTQEQQQYFDEWYTQTKQEVLKNVREANLQSREEARQANHEHPDRHYMPTATSSLDVASGYVSERERAQQVHHSYLPMMPPHQREGIRFLVEQADQVAQQIADQQLDVMVYQMMLDQARGERAGFINEIRNRRHQAENAVIQHGVTYEAIDNILWKLEGRIPDNVRLISATTFEQLPEEERQGYSPIREGDFAQIMQRAPRDIRDMGLDDLLGYPPAVQRLPERFEMNFTDHPDFNSRKFLENMTKQGKQPSLFEKDYAMCIYDTTFGGAFDKAQKGKLSALGMDEFDLITIDGRTVNEMFADKYKDMEPQRRNEMLRCEVVAAVMGAEKNVAFSRIRTNEQGEPEIAPPSAMTRGGNLHDPRPTLGQRFLNFFNIKKYVPLSQKMAQANLPARTAAARGQAAEVLAEKYSQDKLNRQMLRGQYRKMNEANTGKRIEAEFKEAFGREHEGAVKEIPGFAKGEECGLGSQLGRPSTGVALVYAKLLQEGHKLADIMDPNKLKDERRMAGRRIAEQMKTPEGVGQIIAEATKTYVNLDIRSEMAYALGRELDTPEALEQAMTGEKEMATTLPMLRKFYSCSREMHQCVNALYNFNSMVLMEKPDMAAQEILTAGKNEAAKQAFGAFCENITTEDLQARRKVSDFNNSLMRGNRIDALRDYYLSDDFVEGRPFAPEFNSLEDMTIKAMVTRDVLAEAARTMGDSIATITLPGDTYYTKEVAGKSLSAYTPEQLTRAIAEGTRSPIGQAIADDILNPVLRAEKVQQIKESDQAFLDEREAGVRAQIAERRNELAAERQARESAISQEIDEIAAEVRTRPRAKSVHLDSESISFKTLLEEDDLESGKAEKKARRQSVELSKSAAEKAQKSPFSEQPELKKDDEITRKRK